MRVSPKEFLALPLEVHAVLRDVPLKDVSVLDLPGGGPSRTVADVLAFLSEGEARGVNGPVRALVAIRSALGRWFGWDAPSHSIAAHASDSYASRIGPDLAGRSSVPVGTRQGGRRTLYVLEREALIELRNATVHAFIAPALVPQSNGYRLYLAIYVKPISRFTSLYMAAIEPFRRFVVYPSLLRMIRREWVQRYG